MATVTEYILSDSLDERIKNGVETVTFFHPVFGSKMEIELGEANRKHFAAHLEKLAKYIDAAREVEETVEPAKVASKNDLTAVREWARANGFQVGDRGRIKAEILEAYDKAQMPTAVEGGTVVLAATPEAAEKLEDIADSLPANAEPEASTERSAKVDAEPISQDDFLVLMEKASQDGEVTMEKLAELASQD